MTVIRTQRSQHAPLVGVRVLVADKDDDIHRALEELLEIAGYAVTRVADVDEAINLVEAALEPVVLLAGNADAVDYDVLQHFTVVASDPVTQSVHIYYTAIPQRLRLPGLVHALTQQADSTVDQPYELAYLLAVVAKAAAHTRS